MVDTSRGETQGSLDKWCALEPTGFQNSDSFDGNDDYPIDPNWGFVRRAIHMAVSHETFKGCISFLIIAHIATMSIEVEHLAASHMSRMPPNPVFRRLELFFQVSYTAEISMRIFVQRWDYFRIRWQLVDFTIVMLAWVDLALCLMFDFAVPNAHVLRILRIVRILRAVRLMARFPELNCMIRGFASAVKSMFWGFLMIVLLLLAFAIVSVELLYDKAGDVGFDEDSWCADVITSVWKTFLMFFQGLVAGDSWGACTLPVIVWQPGMFVIFSGALVCVQLGFTNLILSSIVDCAQKNRDEDVKVLAQRKRQQVEESIQKLQDIISSIDSDKSGDITIEEWLAGYDNRDEMKLHMNMFDLDRMDLVQLFTWMDADRSGTLSYNEFIRFISKSETQDLRVQMMILKLQMSNVSRTVTEEMSSLVNMMSEIVGIDRTSGCSLRSLILNQPSSKREGSSSESVEVSTGIERGSGNSILDDTQKVGNANTTTKCISSTPPQASLYSEVSLIGSPSDNQSVQDHAEDPELSHAPNPVPENLQQSDPLRDATVPTQFLTSREAPAGNGWTVWWRRDTAHASHNVSRVDSDLVAHTTPPNHSTHAPPHTAHTTPRGAG
eukprot:TRINITY_DN794_c0_g1_i1.p1 TRINITY_DN794_c0_g1~~TRINITY_DN794_c0_g1_i1.p1  ORF type:complete len:623 (-),score=83.40 TRINITY_DN794_c0_g1_i1:157-1986(-)